MNSNNLFYKKVLTKIKIIIVNTKEKNISNIILFSNLKQSIFHKNVNFILEILKQFFY